MDQNMQGVYRWSSKITCNVIFQRFARHAKYSEVAEY